MLIIIATANILTMTLYFVTAPLLLMRARVPMSGWYNVLMVGWTAVFMVTNLAVCAALGLLGAWI